MMVSGGNMDILSDNNIIMSMEMPSSEENLIKQEAPNQKTGREVKNENPVLEMRTIEINKRLSDLKKGLKSMEGTPGNQPITNPDDPNRSEMRKILDKEFELNSVQSPIDSKNPNRRTEHQDWLNALEDSKRATKELKASLERRIEDTKTEILKLEEEKRKIEEHR